MSAKAIVIICAQALFAHVVISQCCRSGWEHTCGYIAPSIGVSSCGSQIGNVYDLGSGLGLGIGAGAGFNGASLEAALTNGGGFSVHSSAPIAPSGISVASENAYEGSLNVIGELPFLSAIGLEGVLPTAGAGAVHYSYGNGITAITGELGNSAGGVGLGSAGIVGYGTTVGHTGIADLALRHAGIAGLNCGQAAGYDCGCGLY